MAHRMQRIVRVLPRLLPHARRPSAASISPEELAQFEAKCAAEYARDIGEHMPREELFAELRRQSKGAPRSVYHVAR